MTYLTPYQLARLAAWCALHRDNYVGTNDHGVVLRVWCHTDADGWFEETVTVLDYRAAREFLGY
ncbi:hypothetical protein [Labrys wisconsinensis]|uniref:Uncharacterized protein n=1 Tax=Labrys wisconsinensis TaxID=425677 RepID=A0ABU0JPQ3_9HYPH|nr:hypothetical protein [Labrys wisconsinensis]MDQ0475259.1 hypothetical protein [Labrys wisconsinensis]